MITWNDTFEIIKIMFNIDQKAIANLMGVPDYKISKIKTGNLTPSFSNEDIYRKIFDPNTKDSPAKDTEKYLLLTLEDIIKNGFDNVKEAMKDYWVEDDKYKDGDYKIFVIKMLERTLYIPTSKDRPASSDINNGQELLARDVIEDTPISDKTGETSPDTEAAVTLDEAESAGINNEQEPLVPDAVHENESNDQEANETETQPERMADVFDQSYNDYAVEGFIDSDPTTDRIHDMIHFIGHIREQDKTDCLDKNEEIYQGIVSFVDILQEYLSFLKRSSGNLDFFPDNYTPPNSDNKEFSEELNRYREQLKSLYLPIKVEVEKQRDEKDEQRRAAGKEAWDKSTQKGSL